MGKSGKLPQKLNEMNELKDKVIENLRSVVDPGTTLDVVRMGLIKDLQVTSDGKASFEFHPSSPTCPLVFSLALDIQKVVKNTDGIKDLSITVVGHQMAGELNEFLKD